MKTIALCSQDKLSFLVSETSQNPEVRRHCPRKEFPERNNGCSASQAGMALEEGRVLETVFTWYIGNAWRKQRVAEVSQGLGF